MDVKGEVLLQLLNKSKLRIGSKTILAGMAIASKSHRTFFPKKSHL